jgi:hypothetical protein
MQPTLRILVSVLSILFYNNLHSSHPLQTPKPHDDPGKKVATFEFLQIADLMKKDGAINDDEHEAITLFFKHLTFDQACEFFEERLQEKKLEHHCNDQE